MASHRLLAVLLATAASVKGLALYPTKPADLTTPVQQRLAVIGPSAVSVGWNTYKSLDQACVQYGLAADALTLEQCATAEALSVTYDTSRTYAHAVTLPDLQSATRYYYRIVSGNASVAYFDSPRPAGDTGAFAMNIVIDLGVYGRDGFTISMDVTRRSEIPGVEPALNHTTIGRLAATADDYELVLHPGDFAYADDWFYNVENLLDGIDAYEAIIENFYHQLSPIAGHKPYMASPGNHEAACEELPYTALLCPPGQRNFTDFMRRFGNTMPTVFPSTSTNDTARIAANRAAQLAQPPFWYSFEYGMVHVVMIDTETDFTGAPDEPGGSAGLGAGPMGRLGQQLAFLEADLASVDRTVTPWLVVGGHRPWYSTAPSDNSCSECQTAFEPLFYRYGVDLGIFGHVHNSQRFLPMNNSQLDPAGLNNPRAPVYIVAGGAGNVEGLSSIGANLTGNVFAYADDFSYATLTFADAQHLQIDFVRSATGEVLDRSVLYKEHAEAFVVQG